MLVYWFVYAGLLLGLMLVYRMFTSGFVGCGVGVGRYQWGLWECRGVGVAPPAEMVAGLGFGLAFLAL